MHGLALGGVDFVHKPFDGPELLARVKLHLTIQWQKEELSQYSRKLEKMVDERTAELVKSNSMLAALGSAQSHDISGTDPGNCSTTFSMIYCNLLKAATDL